MRRCIHFLVIALLVCLTAGCNGVYGHAVREPYDKYDPGCIQQDDYMQRNPLSALLGGGP